MKKRTEIFGALAVVAAAAAISAAVLGLTGAGDTQEDAAAAEPTEFTVDYTETLESNTKIVVQPD